MARGNQFLIHKEDLKMKRRTFDLMASLGGVMLAWEELMNVAFAAIILAHRPEEKKAIVPTATPAMPQPKGAHA